METQIIRPKFEEWKQRIVWKKVDKDVNMPWDMMCEGSLCGVSMLFSRTNIHLWMACTQNTSKYENTHKYNIIEYSFFVLRVLHKLETRAEQALNKCNTEPSKSTLDSVITLVAAIQCSEPIKTMSACLA